MKFFTSLFFLIFIHITCWSQDIPFLVNYAKHEYKAAQQNWDVTQDQHGHMYFANTNGLLRYDGVQWKLFVLKDHKIVRSALAVKDRIYVGAYGEFGYWQKASGNDLTYQSLSKLTQDKKFYNEEFWNIIHFQGKIYFQSFGALYCYDGKTIVKMKIPGTIMFAKKIRDDLYLPIIGGGIYKLVNDTFELINGTNVLQKSIVTGMASIGNDELIIATNDDGAYAMKDGKINALNSPINELLKKKQINKLIQYNNEITLFATISDGLYAYNVSTGQTIHINKNKGLQNNTILSVYVDRAKGVWLGLDKGISYIDLNSEFNYFFDKQENLGTIYTIANIDDTKFFGTNQGLYYYTSNKQLIEGNFNHLANIAGQVWDLLTIDNEIICGHNTGTHVISKKGIKKISSTNGGWHTIRVPGHDKLLIQATYTGLIVFQKEGSWKFAFKVDGLSEAIERIVAINSHEFWLCGPIGNLKKVKLSNDYSKVIFMKNYDEKNSGLPSIHKIQIVKVQDNVYVHSNDRQYIYNGATDKFELYQNANFSIRNPKHGFLYYTYSDSIVQLLPQRRTYSKKIRNDYNSIMEVGSELVFLGDDNYFVKAIADSVRYAKEDLPKLTLEGVFLSGSKNYVPYEKMNWKLKFNDGTFDLFFSNAYYKDKVLYRYNLDGPLTESSAWLPLEKVTIKNLQSGAYTFTLESSINQRTSFSFVVSPQWYMSKWMWLLYVCLIGGIIYYYQKKFEKDISIKMLKIEEENARQLREHKIALDNEKLKEDNIHKSKELANTTMELIKKNEILWEIKDELIEIRKKDEALTLKDFQKMMKQINDSLTTDHDHKLFESNFSEVHEDFFKKLLSTYEDLTPQDLKLAAFLKMNLSTKEIAPLFNISVRGLENKRYRLRKKLNLDNEVNLTEFFIKMG